MEEEKTYISTFTIMPHVWRVVALLIATSLVYLRMLS